MRLAHQRRQDPGVVHVVVPRGDEGAFALAPAVAARVHGVHGVAVRGEPSRQRGVQAEVLAVPVQQHDDGAGRFLRQPRFVVDASAGTLELGMGTLR